MIRCREGPAACNFSVTQHLALGYSAYMDRDDQDRSADERDRRDIQIINRNAERLNREAMDTLEYQQLQ